MASTRVYILAKELGIKSSAIVKKCQDEGLDVKNHMSVLSAGLAATIREWFSEGENVTTVETSEKVDLAKVRIKKKKKVVRRRKTKKEKEKPLTAAIRLAVESGKVEFGARRSIKSSLLGKAKLFVLATPPLAH